MGPDRLPSIEWCPGVGGTGLPATHEEGDVQKSFPAVRLRHDHVVKVSRAPASESAPDTLMALSRTGPPLVGSCRQVVNAGLTLPLGRRTQGMR